MKIVKYIKYPLFILFLIIFFAGCNYVTHKTITKEQLEGEDDPEPVYDITLNPDYQDFVTYMYMGNRAEEFGTFFNKFYQALVDYDEALTDYRASTISAYNKRLDSLNIIPPISSGAKEKLNKVLERCSKIIQYNKSTRFLDDAVLLIGKSYFYMGEYLQAERKFNEFLSKLTKSNLYDEAILYLGKTKLKLGKNADAEVIFSNLFKSTQDNEIKSEITQDLALLSISKNNYQDAIEYFGKSIELTKDKEKKAEKQFILAKIYSKFKPEVAYIEFRKSNDLTSDFDLLFYSKLNEAKSLNEIGKTNDAYEILDRLNSKYRDYPELKQQVELEIANTFYYQKKYKEARLKYFEVIVDYAGSKSAADAYYHLAYFCENEKNDYLYAYVNYKKVIETSGASDFVGISAKRTVTLDKYFSLQAIINDTTKIVYPENEPDFIEYKEKREKEKGVEHKENEPKGNENLNPTGPKGGGVKQNEAVLDSLENIKESGLNDSNIVLKKEVKDSLEIKTLTDSLKKENLVKKLSPEDSLLLLIHKEDSIKMVKEIGKIDAYFQISELFLYELGREDSALFYLDKIIVDSINPDRTAKAMYSVATIYKNRNEDAKAKDYYEKIILQYPKTTFANESRKQLGLPVLEFTVDSSEIFFKSAERNIVNNKYESALNDLRNVIYKYPSDSFYVKSLYSLGWIYENAFKNKDSCLAYYKKLKTDFPNSQYTLSVNAKLNFYDAYDKRDTTKTLLDSTGLKIDSLKILSDSNGVALDSLKLNNQPEKEKKTGDKNKNQQENSGEIPPVVKPPEEKRK